MKNSYAEKKLFEAVFALATADAPIRKRLAGAAHHLIGPLMANHFPDKETAKVWQGIVEDLSIFAPQYADEGSIDATTRNLIDHDATRIAERIVELHDRVFRMDYDAEQAPS